MPQFVDNFCLGGDDTLLLIGDFFIRPISVELVAGVLDTGVDGHAHLRECLSAVLGRELKLFEEYS